MNRKEAKRRSFHSRKRRNISKRSTIHLWKRSQIVDKTTNNKEYKIWVKHLEDPFSCWHCAPHDGCNYWRSRKPKKSWKFISKRKKQWKS